MELITKHQVREIQLLLFKNIGNLDMHKGILMGLRVCTLADIPRSKFDKLREQIKMIINVREEGIYK